MTTFTDAMRDSGLGYSPGDYPMIRVSASIDAGKTYGLPSPYMVSVNDYQYGKKLNAIPLEGVPDKMAKPTLTAPTGSFTTFDVSWTKPTEEELNGGTIKAYRISIKHSGGSYVEIPSNEFCHTASISPTDTTCSIEMSLLYS